MADGLDRDKRPAEYAPPQWEKVQSVLTELRLNRQAKIDHLRDVKDAVRDNWASTLRQIPAAYRQVTPPLGFPDIDDMLHRVVGTISKQQLMVEVMPPSGMIADVRKAAGEEKRLHAVRIQVQDQQDQDTYGLGIHSQCAWGESWLVVMPDPHCLNDEELQRGKDESAKDYEKRYAHTTAYGRIPIRMDMVDPQTVRHMYSADRLAVLAIETEHTMLDIELGLGYKPIKTSADGKIREWAFKGKTLSEGYVTSPDAPDGTASGPVIVDRDMGQKQDGRPQGAKCNSVVYLDQWTYQRYLDGVLVEQWEHNYGAVPAFPAYAQRSSDRDPGWSSRGIIDGAITIAKQIIYFSAIMAANAAQHGWPTPFLKNPEHGLVHPITGAPLTRTVVLGEMNLLGPEEDITFPFLNAQMMPDFFKNMDFLLKRLEDMTMQGFGRDVGPDTSGYAVAQLRAMYSSMVSGVYTEACRQWRKAFYMTRHIVKETFPAGMYLRGAVETKEVEGVGEVQYRPELEYSKEHCTDFSIEVHIPEGILQDQMAERKSAIEMVQSGLWSKRRAQEETGVEDVVAENDEIGRDRILNSPAADQQVLTMAMAIAAERYQMTRQDMSGPFAQALQAAQQQLAGPAGGTPGAPAPGGFQNQDAQPANALPGGQPVDQNPTPAAPQQGGPTAGPTGASQQEMGIPGIPGGVPGGQPLGVS